MTSMEIVNWLRRRVGDSIRIVIDYSEEKINIKVFPENVSEEDVENLLKEALDLMKNPKAEVAYIR